MLSEPNWLPLDVVVETNRDAVLATGEPFHVRDIGLLESALHKPVHHWHYGQHDLAELAVQLFLGIAHNHPFEQGNKRTAWTAALMFLEANGYELQHMLDSDKLGEFLTRIVDRKISAAPLVKLLRGYVRPLEFE
ncbi:type II toxin-antitoxin system death-on-curing family toxin [Bradyrhizobium sp. 604_D8_N2_3]|uniref:type II toxin-antitoxin system death-on-curing family toxin n=1 Tax=Bradyrhizobium sp. 604_D8_N2_3 TaxID=3240370 RepID=UPI003F240546